MPSNWAFKIRLRVMRKSFYDMRVAISRYEDRRTPQMILMQRILGEIEMTLDRCEKAI